MMQLVEAVVTAAPSISSWAASAAQGSTFTYYSGNLAAHRFELNAAGLPPTPEIVDANIAWGLYEDGLVMLTQSRIATDCFDYNATRTKKGVSL